MAGIDTGYIKTYNNTYKKSNTEEGMVFDARRPENPASTMISVTESSWALLSLLPSADTDVRIIIHDVVCRVEDYLGPQTCCTPTMPTVIDFGTDAVRTTLGGHAWTITHDKPQLLIVIPGTYLFTAVHVLDGVEQMVEDTSSLGSNVRLRYRPVKPTANFPDVYKAGAV
jgi:hypothetical protein